jgi:hypothetical protein
MPLTVRLDPGTERKLDQLARRTRQTRSDVVREALERYAADQGSGAVVDESALAAWSDVVGIMSSDARDHARTTGERFTDVVRRKARDRRPR